MRLPDSELLEEPREFGTQTHFSLSLAALNVRRQLLRLIDEPVEARVAAQAEGIGTLNEGRSALLVVLRFLRRFGHAFGERTDAFVTEGARRVRQAAENGDRRPDDTMILMTRDALAELRQLQLRPFVVVACPAVRIGAEQLVVL